MYIKSIIYQILVICDPFSIHTPFTRQLMQKSIKKNMLQNNYIKFG